MGVINVLDKHVAELIAAGEVVERPSSVIKELVENSIDAGAKHVTVEIKNGGTTFMRVSDDGCGIMKEDVKTAFMRHATSKVKGEADLDSIATLGFRGEALASICAVSRLQLITRNKNESVGTSYTIEGGDEVDFNDAGCPVGTTFVIRDLFYNIPARAKFLKKDVSEGNAVSNVIDKTALSHPEIAFTYIRDGKQVLKTAGDGKLKSAIYSVLGRDFVNSMIPVDYKLDSIAVKGYVTKPVNSRATRNMENFFINGRYVKTRTGMAAVEEAFKGSIMVGKFPACVLNISLPYEMIDVNVHPAKIEVRFVNERPIFDAVYHAVKTSLMRFDTRKETVFKTDSAFNDIKRFSPFKNAEAVFRAADREKTQQTAPPKKPAEAYNPFEEVEFSEPPRQKKEEKRQTFGFDNLSLADSANPFDIISKEAVRNEKRAESFKKRDPLVVSVQMKHTDEKSGEAADVNPIFEEAPKRSLISEFAPDSAEVTAQETVMEPEAQPAVSAEITEPDAADEPQPLYPQNEDELRYIGEAFKTYIIIEKNKKELVIIDKHAAHERIIYEKLKAEKAGASAQLLLKPITVTLDKAEYDAAINHLEMFYECSFEVEDFGGGMLIVRAAPQYIDASEVADCVTEMAEYIAMGKNDIFTEKMDWFYHNVACRSAIKGGNTNSEQELMAIARRIEYFNDIRYCPHGRPVCVVMKKSELERQFGRA